MKGVGNGMEMEYDYTVKHGNLDYGVLHGGPKVVFIKSGLGSDYIGYENKYLRMAYSLRQTYGCGVIVASNPQDGESHAESDQMMLEQYASEQGINHPEVFFFGSSNGCIKGLELTDHGVDFRRMILVNMPLMINFHKTKGYISAIPRTEILAVYGELDPSISYVPFLRGRFENAEVMTVAGADHNFKGMIEAFISLSDRLLT
jgi:hypothetical protein